MKNLLLTLCSLLFLVGCDGSYTRLEDCMESIAVSDRVGVESASQYFNYSYYETFNFFKMKTEYHESKSPIMSCSVNCKSGYSPTYQYTGARCLENQTACLSSELPSNAVSGFKTLINSTTGEYSSCQVMECALGYTIQANNTCQMTIIPPPPMNPCLINPADPMCLP